MVVEAIRGVAGVHSGSVLGSCDRKNNKHVQSGKPQKVFITYQTLLSSNYLSDF